MILTAAHMLCTSAARLKPILTSVTLGESTTQPYDHHTHSVWRAKSRHTLANGFRHNGPKSKSTSIGFAPDNLQPKHLENKIYNDNKIAVDESHKDESYIDSFDPSSSPHMWRLWWADSLPAICAQSLGTGEPNAMHEIAPEKSCQTKFQLQRLCGTSVGFRPVLKHVGSDRWCQLSPTHPCHQTLGANRRRQISPATSVVADFGRITIFVTDLSRMGKMHVSPEMDGDAPRVIGLIGNYPRCTSL